MTIASDYAPDLYAGNDLTYSFAFTFPVLAKSELVVTRIDDAGVETAQVENTNYRVTNWRKPGDTGTVSMGYYDGPTWTNLPIPVGEQIRLSRVVEYIQPTDLTNSQRYLAESVERGLDRLEMQIQQVAHTGGGGGGAVDETLYVRKLRVPINVKDAPYNAVGDGVTDDTAAIQSAIVAANGVSSVYIPRGTYYIDGQINITVDKTHVFGAGNSTWLKCSGGDKTPYAFYSTADDVVIEDMDITAEYGRYLVVCEGVSRNRFSNLRFVLSGSGSRVGIFIYKDSEDVSITGCQFYNQSWGGIATGGDVTGNVDGPISRVTISGCYFYQCADEAIDINWDTHNVLITDNTIIDCGGASNEAIDIGGGTAPHECTDVNIVNNNFLCTDTAMRCINVKFVSQRTLIANNTFSGPATSGPTPFCIFVEGGALTTEISGNTISGFGRGIVIGSSCLFVKIIGNVIKDPWGHLIHASDVSIGRVDIENNTLVQTAGQEDMVRFQYGIFFKVTGNKVIGRPGRNCFWFNAAAAGPTLVAGNQFIGGNQQIKADASVKNLGIFNNGFSRAEAESISLAGSNSNVNIIGNEFHEWSATGTAYAISDGGGSGRSIVDNAFYNDLTTSGDGCVNFSAVVTGVVFSGNRAGATISGTAFSGLSNITGTIYGNYDASTSTPTGSTIDTSGYTAPESRIVGRASSGSGLLESLTPAQVRSMISSPELVGVPASATDTGSAGQISYDGSYLYVCTSSNTWVRTALSTWVVGAGATILSRTGANVLSRTGDTINHR